MTSHPSGPQLFLGLISGTSADGIDVALVRFASDDPRAHCALVHGRTFRWQPALRARLVALGQGGDCTSLDELGALDVQVANAFADAALALLAEAGMVAADVRALGSHGQTVRHRPAATHPFTMQLGDGNLIAERSGIATVSDFRRRDVAAGGQGAPLVPLFHAGLAQALERPVAVLNLGGVGNVTWIGGDGRLMAFDTGPGNALIDDWALRHTGRPVDADGMLARAGTANGELVGRFAAHPYFAARPAKSLDRDDFRAFVAGLVDGLEAADGAATLTAFTARAVALAVQHLPEVPSRWLVCGGGRRNPAIMAELRRCLNASVEPVETEGWDGDALEAQAFAYLAVRSLRGLPLTLPETTGGPAPMTGGRLYLPG